MSPEQDDRRPPEGPSPMQFIGVGFELVVPVLVGLFGGRWLDRRFGTEPWLLLIGALLGAAAGMLGIYRRIAASGNRPGGGRR